MSIRKTRMAKLFWLLRQTIHATGKRLTMDDSPATAKELSKAKGKTKVAVFVAVIALLAAAGLAIAVGVILSNQNTEEINPTAAPSSQNQPDVCTTTGCAKAAGMVLAALDERVDPCDNFYQFSCGNWIRHNIIPESKPTHSRFAELSEQVNVQLKALLEAPVSVDEPLAVKESKEMYQACFNEEAIEQKGFDPLLAVYEKLGKFPMIDSAWDETSFDFIDLIVALRLYNNKYPVNMYVYADYKNSSKNILQFSQQSFGLPSREYYLSSRYTKELEAYRQFITETATFLNGTEATVKQDVDDLIEFETYLANISQSALELRDPAANYKKYAVSELYTNISSEFEWLRYINNIFDIVNYTFTNKTEIVVHCTQYLIDMTRKVKTTPKRTLANYFMWRFTMDRISNLPKSIKELKTKYDKAVFGVQSLPPRWKECVLYTQSFMGKAVGRLFVDNHFPEEAKAIALDMISGIRESFVELLETVPWLNEKTREVAKEKEQTIKKKIGYPEWIKNDTRLDSEYEGLLGNVNRSNYFATTMLGLKFSGKYDLKTIKEPVKEFFALDPPVVNAYYSGPQNEIVFPAGILQRPFWAKDNPISMNYGAIGMIIGHEISHGFDDRGRQFDKNGNLVKWWDDDVVEAFNEAKQCIIDQYDDYYLPELNRTMNGEQTQSENIADNGGIKQTYQAFLKHQKKHGVGQALPGLEKYSPNHLFFIAFAQQWCASIRTQALNVVLEKGVHSPPMFRVKGSLSNFAEFSKVFGCKSGSPMNPVKKCSVW